LTIFSEDYAICASTTISAIAQTCNLAPVDVVNFTVSVEVLDESNFLGRIPLTLTTQSESAVLLCYRISANQPYLTYASVTGQLTEGVENGLFNSNLATEAVMTGASVLKLCYSDSVQITYVAGALSSGRSSTDVFRTASAVLALSAGGVICAVVISTLYVRSFSKQHLETAIDDMKSLSPTVLIKAVSASMVLYQLIIVQSTNGYFLLLLSRGIELLGWFALLYLLLVPYKRLDPNVHPNANMIPLSLKLYGPAVGYGIKIDSVKNVCGFRSLAMTTNICVIAVCAWDVTFLPLLPWIKTSTTELLNGYPSLSTYRICLCTPLVTQSIQLVYSAFLFSKSERNFANSLFEIASLIYWLYALLRTVLYLRFTRNEQLGLAIVNVSDLRKFANKDAFHMTLTSNDDIRRYLADRILDSANVNAQIEEDARASRSGLEMSLHLRPTEVNEVAIPTERTPGAEVSEADGRCFDDDENISLQDINDGESLQEFTTTVPFASETTEVLRNQLRAAGVVPLIYIPKDQLQNEINQLISEANSGSSFNESRLDYLLKCLDANPQYQVYRNIYIFCWHII
jgi:hypothetical protein